MELSNCEIGVGGGRFERFDWEQQCFPLFFLSFSLLVEKSHNEISMKLLEQQLMLSMMSYLLTLLNPTKTIISQSVKTTKIDAVIQIRANCQGVVMHDDKFASRSRCVDWDQAMSGVPWRCGVGIRRSTSTTAIPASDIKRIFYIIEEFFEIYIV